MIIPCYHGRPMKKLEEYPSFVLFQDVKTGVKVSYKYQELDMKQTAQLSDKECKQFKRHPYEKIKY